MSVLMISMRVLRVKWTNSLKRSRRSKKPLLWTPRTISVDLKWTQSKNWWTRSELRCRETPPKDKRLKSSLGYARMGREQTGMEERRTTIHRTNSHYKQNSLLLQQPKTMINIWLNKKVMMTTILSSVTRCTLPKRRQKQLSGQYWLQEKSGVQLGTLEIWSYLLKAKVKSQNCFRGNASKGKLCNFYFICQIYTFSRLLALAYKDTFGIFVL